jgi:hypothetical protein
MILMYMLFALTASAILIALFSKFIPRKREGEAFIVFFAALMIVAWAVDAWVLPDLAHGQIISWLPTMLLIMFGAIFAASTILLVRKSTPLHQVAGNHDNRFDAEAAVFDLILWFAFLSVGIIVLISAGL